MNTGLDFSNMIKAENIHFKPNNPILFRSVLDVVNETPLTLLKQMCGAFSRLISYILYHT